MSNDQHGLGRHVFCPECRSGAGGGASFCSNCGHSLLTNSEPAKTTRAAAVVATAGESRSVPASVTRKEMKTAQPERSPGKWFAWGIILLLLAAGDLLIAALSHKPAAMGGLLPLAGLGGAVYHFVKWWRAVRHPILSHQVKRNIAKWWTIAGVVAIGIGGATSGNDNSGGSTLSAAFIFFGMAWIMFFWAAVWAVKFGSTLGQEVHAASTPIPSPAEISAQLEAEWGRPAPVEEVAAVHQMLTSRKNEALLGAGIGLGALYLMDRNIHGGQSA